MWGSRKRGSVETLLSPALILGECVWFFIIYCVVYKYIIIFILGSWWELVVYISVCITPILEVSIGLAHTHTLTKVQIIIKTHFLVRSWIHNRTSMRIPVITRCFFTNSLRKLTCCHFAFISNRAFIIQAAPRVCEEPVAFAWFWSFHEIPLSLKPCEKSFFFGPKEKINK